MRITIKLFAVMAEHAGRRSIELQAPSGTALDQLIAILRQSYPDLPWPPGTMLAVNQQYAPAMHPLRDGDEVAVIPPVSGG